MYTEMENQASKRNFVSIKGAARAAQRLTRSLIIVVAMFSIPVGAGASGGSEPTRPIEINQTDGYGNERLVAFTYFMNFQCIHEPFDDLDIDGNVAAIDPDEFQTPRCIVGDQPTLDPTGDPIQNTEPLFVIVPFFDADGDGEAATPDLGAALTGLFNFVPDAFDPTPGVPVQCPEPGPPLTKHTGDFGTCTMHPTQVDLGPVLGQLGLVPAGTSVQVPTPNHSHIINGANFKSVWWQVIVVLVTDQGVWPNVGGTAGLNSVDDLRRAQAGGKASGDIPTNFFLFFDSRQFDH